MIDDREKISTGPNDRPLNETIAGTGPGIPTKRSHRARSYRKRLATRKSSASPKNSALRPQNATHYRWKVSKSRRKLTDDSVIVQFLCLIIAL